MRNTYSFEGTKYLLGNKGSLILACPRCGEEHFRDHWWYFNYPLAVRQRLETCMSCDNEYMEPIREDELESRWFPFWLALGHEVFNADGTPWGPLSLVAQSYALTGEKG